MSFIAQRRDMLERERKLAIAALPPAPARPWRKRVPPEALSRRQLDVVAGVLAGKLNKTIAYELGLTESTVKAYVTQAMTRAGVATRTQLALWFVAQIPAPARDGFLHDHFAGKP